MHVVHVVSSLDPVQGGPVTALVGLARAQAQIGMCVHVVSPYAGSAPPSTVDALRNVGVEVHLIGPAKGRFSCWRQMRRVLREHIAAADVAHLHGLWEEIQHFAAVTARSLRKPYVITPHGMLDRWSLRQKWLKKQVYMALRLRRDLKQASALHLTADAERDQAQLLGLPCPHIVVPNGLDLSEFAALPPKGFLAARWPQLQGKRILLFLGRVHPKKRPDLLISALPLLHTANAVAVIVGPGDRSYVDTLHSLARELNVLDRVCITGPLYGAERLAAFVDSDLFVLPSEQENFGIAVIEALAAGTPVILSDQVAIWREIVEAGVGAAVPLDVEGLASTMQQWLDTPTLRASASALAPRLVARQYDWTAIAGTWASLYPRYLQRPANL